jgi:hypothetical protein
MLQISVKKFVVVSQKNPFWHSENRKWTFYVKKRKKPKMNIV